MRPLSAELQHRLGVYLWRSSLTEQIAAGVFEKLARWDWLEMADRARAGEFAGQESTHASLLRGLAKDLYHARPDEHLRALKVPSNVWQALAGVVQAERMSFPGFQHMVDLGRELEHEELVAAYQQITTDEAQHLVWGKGVMDRFRREPEIHRDVMAYLKTHPIAEEYRQVARERPWRCPR